MQKKKKFSPKVLFTFFWFPSIVADAIMAVNPFIARMPDDLQEMFIRDCLKQVEELDLTEKRNNGYNVKYKLIVVHIRKQM